MNNQYYNYAELGSSCQTNFSVLTDAHKYFPLNEPDYSVVLTKTTHALPIVFESNGNGNKENFEITKAKGCCGKRLYGL